MCALLAGSRAAIRLSWWAVTTLSRDQAGPRPGAPPAGGTAATWPDAPPGETGW